MKRKPSIGFIGFGEAGSHIASGLQAEGLDRLFTFDIRDVRERARNAAPQFRNLHPHWPDRATL